MKNKESLNIGLALILNPQAKILLDLERIWVGDYSYSYSKMTDEEKEIMKDTDWYMEDGY